MRWFKAVFGLRAFKPTIPELERIHRRLNAAAKPSGMDHAGLMISEMSAVVQKSGTLLTHISMMIAITGLLWALKGTGTELEVIFGIHLIAYLFLALLCIRCQMQFDLGLVEGFEEPDQDDANSSASRQFDRALKGELFFRERTFRSVMWTLYALTFFLSLTVLAALFLSEISLLLSGDNL